MIVSRILHAGYIFESAGVRIAFDPIFETPFSTNCFPFPPVEFSPAALAPPVDSASDSDSPKLPASSVPLFPGVASPIHDYDAVFISHFHDDHCSLVSLNALPRTTPIYLYCVHEELFEMLRALGFAVDSLSVDSPVVIGGFVVTPRLALDPDVDAVYEIVAEDLAVLNVVDAWIDPSVLKLRPKWDLVLWPFQTMRELDVLMPTALEDRSDNEIAESRRLPPEWVEQIRELNARFVVPSSCQIRFEDWSWMNLAYFPITYAQFAREISQSVRLNPGETFELTSSSFERIGRLDWITPVGPQDVDYDYDATVLQKTAPESVNPRHPLSRTTAEIAQHFPALTPDERAQVDRFCEGLDVTLFDHEGVAKGSGSTEAIAYKVYRALTEGEQITSMYLRSADVDTDDLIAKLSDDPLAFQRAQLRRLLAPARTRE